MNNDNIQKIQRLINDERADAYKMGFSDGVAFSENSNSFLPILRAHHTLILDQVWDIYGQGKEYKFLKECLNAIYTDLENWRGEDKEIPIIPECTCGHDDLPYEYHFLACKRGAYLYSQESAGYEE